VSGEVIRASSEVIWAQKLSWYEIRANHILSFDYSPKSRYPLRKVEIFAGFLLLDLTSENHLIGQNSGGNDGRLMGFKSQSPGSPVSPQFGKCQTVRIYRLEKQFPALNEEKAAFQAFSTPASRILSDL
jgi:hypothetical protein